MSDLELAFGQAVNLGTPVVFNSLFLSFLLGLLVSLMYRYSTTERSAPVMRASLVLLAMIGAMVMMVIGNNIARAFSLVGALAIIRFRTRLRSPWDITFVFFALGVGIASGVGAWRVAILGATMISLAVIILQAMPWMRSQKSTHYLRCDLAAYENAEEQTSSVLKKYLRRHWLEEARSTRFGETISYRYRIQLKDDGKLEEFLRALSDTSGVEQVLLNVSDPVDLSGES